MKYRQHKKVKIAVAKDSFS